MAEDDFDFRIRREDEYTAEERELVRLFRSLDNDGKTEYIRQLTELLDKYERDGQDFTQKL